MNSFAAKEKRSAPAVRKARPYVYHPMGHVQQAQQAAMRKILRPDEVQAKPDNEEEEPVQTKRIQRQMADMRGIRPSRFGYVGPEAKAQQAEIHRILRSTGAQAKLTVGQPNDKYEQEADRVADQVMAMLDPKLRRQPENKEEEETLQTKPLADQISSLVQRQEEPPEEEEEIPVHAKEMPGQTPKVTPNVESKINSLKDSGQPLDPSTRSFFEPRFGHDFSQVRVHADGNASEAAKSVNAQSFTLSNTVVFGAGEYSSDTLAGRKLLAHELTHVIQQTGGEQLQRKSLSHRKYHTSQTCTSHHATNTNSGNFSLSGLTDTRIQRDEDERQGEIARLEARLTALRERLRSIETHTPSLPEQLGRAEARSMVRRERGRVQAGEHEFRLSPSVHISRRALNVIQSGNNVTVVARLQIVFPGRSSDEASRLAATTIPMIRQEIIQRWSAQITQGPYSGVRFSVEPNIELRQENTPPSTDAWQLIVRQQASGDTVGNPVLGTVDINPDHLASGRIRVIAHELYHLFGFVDSYLIPHSGRLPGATSIRAEPGGQGDLLGLVDPVVLARYVREGYITQDEADRQLQELRIWEEDAVAVLQWLGVAPLQAAELERAAERVSGARRTLMHLEWLQVVEEIIQLQQQIERLSRE